MMPLSGNVLFFFFNDPATTEIYTLSLHDALPISSTASRPMAATDLAISPVSLVRNRRRSEEHTSELQSPNNLVCRLLLEQKNIAVFRDQRQTQPRHRRTEQAQVCSH